MRLQAEQEAEHAEQIHLDHLLAQRMQEEQEMTEQQKKRQAEVLESAKYYTEEDWDIIRANIESNAELSKILLGENEPGEDFATRMVNLLNQRKKFFAEQRAQARRNRPMTQTQQRTYMSTYLKHQGSRYFTIEEVSFMRILRLREVARMTARIALEFAPDYAFSVSLLLTRLCCDDIHDVTPRVSALAGCEKVKVPEEINMNVVTRLNGSKRYFSVLFRVLSIFDRDDLSALYQLVIDKYQDEIPEGFNLILWGDLTTMFHPNEGDDFWKSQEKWNIVSWKLHKSSGVHTLKIDTEMVIYMLVEKKYPLMKKVLMHMLELKLESEDDSTIALWLIKFIKQQI
ncbi:hypothetical protein Tco_0691855 [Tanacetum coccineum]